MKTIPGQLSNMKCEGQVTVDYDCLIRIKSNYSLVNNMIECIS